MRILYELTFYWKLTVSKIQLWRNPLWAECPPPEWPWSASSLKRERDLFYNIILHEEFVTVLSASSLTSYILRDPSQLANRLPTDTFPLFCRLYRIFKVPFRILRISPGGFVKYSVPPFSKIRRSDFILRDLPLRCPNRAAALLQIIVGKWPNDRGLAVLSTEINFRRKKGKYFDRLPKVRLCKKR